MWTELRHYNPRALQASSARALQALGMLAVLGAFAAYSLQTTLTAGSRASATLPPFELCSSAGVTTMQSSDARPRPVPRVVSSEPMAHVPGKRVTMVIVDFPPGSHSPPHRHAGSVSVFVLSGKIYSQLEGGPMGDFRQGDTFFESPGIIHVASGNNTEENAQILAVFVHDEGATLTTYLP